MRRAIIVACLVGAAWIGQVASAGPSYLFEFGEVYKGDTPNGSGPWITAQFEDAGTDTVRVTITNLLMTSSEHIKQLNFNLDPTLDTRDLEIKQVGDGPDARSAEAIENAFNAGKSKNYDIELAWKGRNGKYYGGSQSVVTFEISGISGLTASSFLFFNDDWKKNAMHYYGAAHVDGIGRRDGSSWIGANVVAIPLPLPVMMGAAGLAGLAVMRRRRA